MKSARYASHGNPNEVIELVELESRPLEEGKVRIAMEACAINPADLLVISGLYPIRPTLPATPGVEGVGKIIEVDSKVTQVKIGDRVFLPMSTEIGTWSEEIVVNGNGLFPISGKSNPVQLAMALVNPPTAYFMLTKYITLKEGDWIIQNAANSGVGRYVIAFAKMMGLKTVNVVRRESIISDLQAAGGNIVIVDGKDLVKRVSKATNRAEIKIGFDGVAGDATHRISQCLVFGGTIVSYGAMSLERCQLGVTQTIFKQITLKGIWYQKWTEMAPPEEVQKLKKVTYEAIANGLVSSKVDTIYPLKDIKQAILHALKDKRNGKIIITGPAYQKTRALPLR